MVARVEQMTVEWSTQDRRCGRCSRVCINDFMEHCPCSGAWVETVQRADLERTLRLYATVATTFGLKMLTEAIVAVRGES